MTKIHNASVHAQVICNITETVTSPLLHLLASTAEVRKEKLAKVEAENTDLEKKIAELQKQLEVSWREYDESSKDQLYLSFASTINQIKVRFVRRFHS